MLLSTSNLAGEAQTGQTVRLSLAACRLEEPDGITDRVGGTKRVQGGGPASPEVMSRSQAWTSTDHFLRAGNSTWRAGAEPGSAFTTVDRRAHQYQRAHLPGWL